MKKQRPNRTPEDLDIINWASNVVICDLEKDGEICKICEDVFLAKMFGCNHCHEPICEKCVILGSNVWGVDIDISCKTCLAVLCNECIHFCIHCNGDNGCKDVYCMSCLPPSYSTDVVCAKSTPHALHRCSKHQEMYPVDTHCRMCSFF